MGCAQPARGWGFPRQALRPAPCLGVHPPARARCRSREHRRKSWIAHIPPRRALVPVRPVSGGSRSNTNSGDPLQGLAPLAVTPAPPSTVPRALAKETRKRCLPAGSTRAQMSNPLPPKDRERSRPAAARRPLLPLPRERGEPGPAPTWPERQTEKGHRVRLLHGTRALLPASAGTGQFLLHGISKAGRRAGHGGEVGKSWCVWQDFSRGFIAAGERGSRRGQREDEDRKGAGGEREKAEKFWSEAAVNPPPCAGSQRPLAQAGVVLGPGWQAPAHAPLAGRPQGRAAAWESKG